MESITMLTHEDLKKRGWKDFHAVLKNAYTDEPVRETTIFAPNLKNAQERAFSMWGVQCGRKKMLIGATITVTAKKG